MHPITKVDSCIKVYVGVTLFVRAPYCFKCYTISTACHFLLDMHRTSILIDSLLYISDCNMFTFYFLRGSSSMYSLNATDKFLFTLIIFTYTPPPKNSRHHHACVTGKNNCFYSSSREISLLPGDTTLFLLMIFYRKIFCHFTECLTNLQIPEHSVLSF